MGGFSNDEFKTFCQNLNIKICTTAAKSPWSNNLVECHDVWLKLIVCKTIEEINCDLDVAVAWALSAKNSLKNGNGFSPRSTCTRVYVIFNTGDPVFFKRKYILTWTGPGTAIVQDGQQILTNHRSTYIRVYPYNFKLKKYQ